MATNPNAAPPSSPERQKPRSGEYSFESALHQQPAFGNQPHQASFKDFIHAKIAGLPKEKAEKAYSDVLEFAQPFAEVGKNIFAAAHSVNRMPDFARYPQLDSLDRINIFMPGAKTLVGIAQEAAQSERKPSPEENNFLEAMEWKAMSWQERAKGDKVETSDYEHLGNLSYCTAQDDVINDLIKDALAKRDNALLSHGHHALAEDYEKTAKELVTYRAMYNSFTAIDGTSHPELFKLNKFIYQNPHNPTPLPVTKPKQNAAEEYMETVKAPVNATMTNQAKKAMLDQQELDRIYATYNSRVKDEMRTRLDKADEKQLKTDTDYVDMFIDKLSTRYKKRQSGIGLRSHDLEKVRKNYDRGVSDLVKLNTRIAVRNARDEAHRNGKKFDKEDEEAVINDTVSKLTNTVHSKLSNKIADKHKGSGKWYSLNSLTGRNIEGRKVKKGRERKIKIGFNALKAAGLIAGTILSGGTGLVVAGGVVAGTHFYMKREAEAREKRVAERTAGIAKDEAVKAAVKAVKAATGNMRLKEKIEAANKLNRESNDKKTQEYIKNRRRRAAGAAALVALGLAAPSIGMDDFVVDRIQDLTGAIHNELLSWGDAWSIDEWESATPTPSMPDWYYQSPEDLGMPHN